MKIKTLHAHFLVSTGNYANERLGFSVELEEGEDIENIIPILREKAIKLIGRKANELYDERHVLERAIRDYTTKLEKLREEWDATAQFLKAQGLNPDAPSMPQFRNLLNSVTVEHETVTCDDDDDDFTSM